MVEHLDMAFASTSSVSSIVVRGSPVGHVAVQYIHLLASVTMQRAVQMLDRVMMQP